MVGIGIGDIVVEIALDAPWMPNKCDKCEMFGHCCDTKKLAEVVAESASPTPLRIAYDGSCPETKAEVATAVRRNSGVNTD